MLHVVISPPPGPPLSPPPRERTAGIVPGICNTVCLIMRCVRPSPPLPLSLLPSFLHTQMAQWRPLFHPVNLSDPSSHPTHSRMARMEAPFAHKIRCRHPAPSPYTHEWRVLQQKYASSRPRLQSWSRLLHRLGLPRPWGLEAGGVQARSGRVRVEWGQGCKGLEVIAGVDLALAPM